MIKMKNSSWLSSPVFSLISRVAIPVVFLFWFLVLVFSKSFEKPKLRGNSNFPVASMHPILSNNELDHLIIVPGHAAVKISKISSALKEDNAWYLLSYQREQGFPSIIMSHISRGIRLASEDTRSMLIFSGGQTRKDVGPISEAASYYFVARENKLLGNQLVERVYLEEYARDSFENVLFSICRYREITGKYPSRISVVGFDFKGPRFTRIHRRAISFPESNFSYVGIRPSNNNFDYSRAKNGETEAVMSFVNDLYGCSDDSLSSKRKKRDPFSRSIPYELSCPEIKELFRWCGPDIYTSPLPWN